MDTLLKDHQRYRWFVTSAGTLVVGGKNAAQNDQLLHLLTASEKKRMVMHTREPGSPFCVLLTDVEKITAQEREECAIYRMFQSCVAHKKENSHRRCFFLFKSEKKSYHEHRNLWSKFQGPARFCSLETRSDA